MSNFGHYSEKFDIIKDRSDGQILRQYLPVI